MPHVTYKMLDRKGKEVSVKEDFGQDFSRKYGNTVFRLPSHDNILFHLRDVTMTDRKGESVPSFYGYTLNSASKFNEKRLFMDDVVFDFSFPSIGYMQHKGEVAYISIVPKTQSKRCFSEGIMRVSSIYPDTEDYTDIGFNTIAYNMFNPIYSTVEAALSTIAKGKAIGKCIEKDWAIQAVRRIHGVIAVYKTYPIGRVNEDNGNITPFPFMLEFREAIIRNKNLTLA